MKRCLVISDSFKGTLSSPDICRIARSISLPGWHIDALPVADGGEGTTDCFLDACGGQKRSVAVTDPFGDPLTACYGLLPDGTAVIECAAAAGLPQAEGRLDPERTTTYGVGQLLAHALDHGAQRLILGLGGSCTNDGGCGAAAA
ncbi:MAG: glycerate kinase, partial [Clostridiales bacterium]|nr:glycerate kinase [Clostridiales bacterium]